MARQFWTAEEEDALSRLVEAGRTDEQIAGVLRNRSAASIRSKATSLGLQRPTADPCIDYERLNILLGDGARCDA